MFRKLIDHPVTFWVLLALPSVPMVMALLSGEPGADGEPVTHSLLHPTGEFSARFMIIAMILTPLVMLFPRSGFLRWLIKRRRHLGVAAFFYALLHTILYVIDMGAITAILKDFTNFGIWTGWLAFVVFVPLAVTSNDFYLRRLGPKRWKALQRWVYLAAIATLLHWMFVHNEIGPALVHFVPLAALELYRIVANQRVARPA